MSFLLRMFFLIVVTSVTSSLAVAQGAVSLTDLLDKVTAEAKEESRINKERESRFRAAASEQNAMLVAAQSRVRAAEAMRDSLRTSFDGNELKIGELQEVLDRRTGDLGELFGVFRQTADDVESTIFTSLVSLEKPERKTRAAALAATQEVPKIEEMRALWKLLIEEVAYSGTISKFDHEVVAPNGKPYVSEVVRVGTFNVVTSDLYLNYLSDSDSLIELARQPAGYVRATASDLTKASAGELVDFTVDPSRGALLGLLVQSPSLMERIEQGGTVGYAIIIVGIIGLLIILERYMRLTAVTSRMKKQLKNLEQVDTNNPVGRVMSVYYENKHIDIETLERKLQEVIIKDMADIKRGLPIVKVLAAVAPLMGLLGTVTGMIGTFQAITLFGTGDPKLMAGGISQALITTVLGLCAAIPLLLTHSVINSKVTQVGKVISEQAAGLMAKKAEAYALLSAEAKGAGS